MAGDYRVTPPPPPPPTAPQVSARGVFAERFTPKRAPGLWKPALLATAGFALAAIGALIVLGLSQANLGHPPSKTRPAPASRGDALGAELIARQFVCDHLKAPSTARFDNEAAIPTESGMWLVRGEVTAKNPFGVPIRHRYAVAVRYKGNHTWSRETPILFDD